MSLLRYLKPIDGLPDPRGCREAIAAANQEVQKEPPRNVVNTRSILPRSVLLLESTAVYMEQRNTFVDPKSVTESIKKAYLQEMRKRPRSDDGEKIAALPTKKRGRKLLFGEDLDMKVQI